MNSVGIKKFLWIQPTNPPAKYTRVNCQLFISKNCALTSGW